MAEHFRQLEQMYHSAPINQIFTPKLVISEDKAEITMEVKQEHFHAGDALHGAIFFKMLDDAAFFAANAQVTDVFMFTTQFNIHYFKPVKTSIIKSVGRVVSAGKSSTVAEAKLYCEDKLVAMGTGTFVKSKIPLSKLTKG